MFGVLGLRFRVLCFGFEVQGLGCGVQCLVFRVLGLVRFVFFVFCFGFQGVRVWGLVVGVWCLAFGVYDLGVGVKLYICLLCGV